MISSARQFDSEVARIIKASIMSGIWENGNNSLRARFTSQAARQARSRSKQVEAAKLDGGQKKLKAKLRDQELEIQQLRLQLVATQQPIAGPSTRRRKGMIYSSILT